MSPMKRFGWKSYWPLRHWESTHGGSAGQSPTCGNCSHPYAQPEAPPVVRIAGRIVLRRVMGNVHFLDVKDSSGRIQVMMGKKQIGETGWKLAALLDLGDLIGIDGTFGLTKTGELTVFTQSLTILAKSVLPHPDKHAGMTDIEFRLRHRYLDLTYNPEVLERIEKRVRMVRTMRKYLDSRGFLEVESPTLHSLAGVPRLVPSPRITTLWIWICSSVLL